MEDLRWLFPDFIEGFGSRPVGYLLKHLEATTCCSGSGKIDRRPWLFCGVGMCVLLSTRYVDVSTSSLTT